MVQRRRKAQRAVVRPAPFVSCAVIPTQFFQLPLNKAILLKAGEQVHLTQYSDQSKYVNETL
ncbi:MAG: hypothetical protein BA861_01410 [Desulfobacterales bacterium S3730MH5]|nr:MAG: hypothetical protein BA861_01410 [Desulfobacterales bacterium S3730MH5]